MNPQPESSPPALNQDFLFALLREAGPSGFERRAADVWKKEAATFARVSEDHYGNVYAELGPEDAPAVALLGHLDEIGLMVSHVGDEGFLSVLAIGGWDPQVLVGQRVRLLAPEGDLIGVIGKKAIHVMEPEDRKNASKLEDLWIDVGLGKEEAQARIPVGTVGVIEQAPVMVGDRIVSRALDNRVGAFVVLEALRALRGADLKHRVVAVGTSQEEIGSFGSQVGSHRLKPVAGVAVDVTHETKQPGVSEKKYGVVPFGSGANLSVGAMTSPVILRQMIAAAQQEGIPYTLSANPRLTHTDADTMILSRSGVPGAVVSVPNRYMHSPNEMVDARDVQACIDLLAAWVRGLDAEPDFTR
ncbi:M42 family metallopeptidase [Deinococcus aluminii]|uniref:Aminopeptidase YsdC n=1 Tax=Deinococcus aluminii TaxID=1656885 RepID=A0ABP9XH88_9DEIO